MSDPITHPDPWQALRRFTAARIALGHTGVSQPTSVHLDFQLAHARARDAVHQALDTASLAAALAAAWPGSRPVLQLHSAAQDRNLYLQRPDLGRRLDAPSRALLSAGRGGQVDLAVVVADGREASSWIAANGALGASGVVLDVFGDGESVSR